VADLQISAITPALLKGLLEPFLEEPVNLVNAGALAKVRGITIVERRTPDAGPYATLVTISGTTADGTQRTVAGTLANGEPRFVRLDDYWLDVAPAPWVLISTHTDRPGMIGVKLYHQYLYDDPILVPIVEAAARRGAVVLLHQGKCNDDASRAAQPLISDGTHIARLAARVPEARQLCGHIGGGGDWEWTVKALKRSPSVCVDTSGSVIDEAMVDMAVKVLTADRLLFGCDMSWTAGIGKIRAARLSAEDRRKILGGNMQRLLAQRARPQ
jgi:hypothetical protein